MLITLKLRVAEASSGDNSTTIACGSTKIANRQELLDVAPGALIIAETGRDEETVVLPGFEVVSTREHGVAKLAALRAMPDCGAPAS